MTTPRQIVHDLQILAKLATATAEEWGEITPMKKAVWGYDPVEASLRHMRRLITDQWQKPPSYSKHR